MNTLHKNLRFDTAAGSFIPTKSTRRFSDLSITPLLPLPHGRFLLCHSGTDLHILDTTTDTVLLSQNTSATIFNALLCSDNLAVVFLSTGQLTVRYHNNEWKFNPPVTFPELKISRADDSVAEETVAERKLSKAYSLTDHQLNSTDSASITTDLLAAYSNLRTMTRGAGVFMQPVIARCRYLDKYGNTIFVTPPQMISADSVFQCSDSLTSVINADTSTRGAMKIIADTFRLSITLPGNSCPAVSKLLIEVTPQLDLINFNGSPMAAVMRNSDGNLLIRTTLPFAPYSTQGKNRYVQSVLNHLESLYRVASVVVNPFDGTSKTITIGADTADATDLKTEVATLRKTMSSPKTLETTYGIPLAHTPHTLTCRTAARNGDTLLMGDISLLPFQGYALDTFGLRFADENWKAAVAVEFSGTDSEKIVRYSQGNTNSPIAIGPVITYPAANATSMTVFFQTGGSCYKRTFPLTPSTCGRFAYYLNPDLKPINMKEESADYFIVPAENPAVHRYPGTIAVANCMAPCSPYDFRHITNTPVTAITHAHGSTSGWDYVRSRFYLFSPEGTFTVITDTNSIRSMNLLDSRGVSDSGNVIPVTRRGVTVLTDSGDMLIWRGVTPTLAGTTLHGQLLYDPIHDELWLIKGSSVISGPAGVKEPFTDDLTVERTFPDTFSALCHTPHGTIIKGSNGLYLAGDEYPGEELVDIRFFKAVQVNRTRNPVVGVFRAIKLFMQSPGPVNLTLTVRGDRGAGIPFSPKFYSFRIRGAVNTPLLFRTASPHCLTVYLSLEGYAPSDSSFTRYETTC